MLYVLFLACMKVRGEIGVPNKFGNVKGRFRRFLGCIFCVQMLFLWLDKSSQVCVLSVRFLGRCGPRYVFLVLVYVKYQKNHINWFRITPKTAFRNLLLVVDVSHSAPT